LVGGGLAGDETDVLTNSVLLDVSLYAIFTYWETGMIGSAELLREIEMLPQKYYGEVHGDEASAYMAMAADSEREQEASEWCNAYFGPIS
jgi:hypothetical protein